MTFPNMLKKHASLIFLGVKAFAPFDLKADSAQTFNPRDGVQSDRCNRTSSFKVVECSCVHLFLTTTCLINSLTTESMVLVGLSSSGGNRLNCAELRTDAHKS